MMFLQFFMLLNNLDSIFFNFEDKSLIRFSNVNIIVVLTALVSILFFNDFSLYRLSTLFTYEYLSHPMPV